MQTMYIYKHEGVTLLAVLLKDTTDNRQLRDCCCIEQANQVSDCIISNTSLSNSVIQLNCGKLELCDILIP